MSYDANKHLTDFHDDRIFVSEEAKETARSRRNANRTRLEKGLAANGDPQPQEFVQQGSYAMDTMVQSETESSDIDDGAVFSKESLKGPRGGDKTPREAKEMVCRALSAKDVFKTPPEVRGNCVRVHYDDGFHVDIPVYRTYEEDGETKKELASSDDWKTSAPEDITNWFRDCVKEKSPDTTKGRQLRRMVRYLKYWSKSRSSWSMPSGFVISVLSEENYPHQGWLDRDDRALLSVMRAIRNRLLLQEAVNRPVNPREEITSDRTRSKVRSMRDELKAAIDELSVIEQHDCDELKAIKALKRVFFTDFWDDRIKELEDGGSGGGGGSAKLPAEPKQPVDKRGGPGQYA